MCVGVCGLVLSKLTAAVGERSGQSRPIQYTDAGGGGLCVCVCVLYYRVGVCYVYRLSCYTPLVPLQLSSLLSVQRGTR